MNSDEYFLSVFVADTVRVHFPDVYKKQRDWSNLLVVVTSVRRQFLSTCNIWTNFKTSARVITTAQRYYFCMFWFMWIFTPFIFCRTLRCSLLTETLNRPVSDNHNIMKQQSYPFCTPNCESNNPFSMFSFSNGLSWSVESSNKFRLLYL